MKHMYWVHYSRMLKLDGDDGPTVQVHDGIDFTRDKPISSFQDVVDIGLVIGRTLAEKETGKKGIAYRIQVLGWTRLEEASRIALPN